MGILRNDNIFNTLPSSLRNAIVDTTVVSGYEYYGPSNYITTDKLFLLSTREVWIDTDGNSTSPYVEGLDYNDTAYDNTRQLDYYAELETTLGGYDVNNGLLGNYTNSIKQYNNIINTIWWLRTPCSNYKYISVADSGVAYYHECTSQYGVSPVFKIG